MLGRGRTERGGEGQRGMERNGGRRRWAEGGGEGWGERERETERSGEGRRGKERDGERERGGGEALTGCGMFKRVWLAIHIYMYEEVHTVQRQRCG